MSVFRSLPDSWAIGQIFPIVPLHRLSEQPEVAGSIADLTCDSDGRVENFISPASQLVERGKPTSYLPLHRLREDEDYLIAAFLVGAYQESMGSCGHNLFGSPAVATVHTSTNHESDVLERISFKFGDAVVIVRPGQTTQGVLQNVGVHPEGLKNWINAGEPPRNSFQRELLETYEDVLKSLTYLECDR
jgi:arginine decarboxylase